EDTGGVPDGQSVAGDPSVAARGGDDECRVGPRDIALHTELPSLIPGRATDPISGMLCAAAAERGVAREHEPLPGARAHLAVAERKRMRIEHLDVRLSAPDAQRRIATRTRAKRRVCAPEGFLSCMSR